MWKENLPINCPPATAQELNVEVFRIIKTSIPTEEDFKPYYKLYPDNPRYNSVCKAFAISFYDTLANAKIALEEAIGRGNKIGSSIGKYTITETDGKTVYTAKSGHYSTWFYQSWDFKDFKHSLIAEIHEN